jgi:hypothetical protein
MTTVQCRAIHHSTSDTQDTHTELVGSPSTAAPLTLVRMLGRFSGLLVESHLVPAYHPLQEKP